jgi:hypothetical protein
MRGFYPPLGAWGLRAALPPLPLRPFLPLQCLLQPLLLLLLLLLHPLQA